MIESKRIAITHDWLVEYAGAERVLEQILKITGTGTSIFTNIFDERDFPFISSDKVQESYISRLPWARSIYRSYLPLMPLAVEQWDMSHYDLVISSSYAVAKGFISHPDQLHISYVHSPLRYGWDMQSEYLKDAKLDTGARGWIIKYLLYRIRNWDVRTANQVDHFIANSHFIQRRIRKVYRRESHVIYPPVDTEKFFLKKEKEDFYCTVSRMVPYKKMPLIIRAFNKMPKKKIYVIGGGPYLREMRRLANENVVVLGHQNFEDMLYYMQNAKAFVYAAKEDFGIVPVEAQACGTPVIGFGKGGLVETVKPYSNNNKNGATGILYEEQTESSLIEAINFFEKIKDRFQPEVIRSHAEYFGQERFRAEMKEFIEEKWELFSSTLKIK